MEASGSATRRQQRDKERAAELKRLKVERRTGRCAVCYGLVGNDTFGGFSVYGHYARHARGYEEQ